MGIAYVDEGLHRKACGDPSLHLDQCWLCVELTWKEWPGYQIPVPKFPLPICSPPVSNRKLPGQTQWPVVYYLWAQSSIQMSVWDYVRMRQAFFIFKPGQGILSYSFDLWRSYKIHDLSVIKFYWSTVMSTFLSCQLLILCHKRGSYHKKPLIPWSWMCSLSSVWALWVDHHTAGATFLNLKSVLSCLDFDYYPGDYLAGLWEEFSMAFYLVKNLCSPICQPLIGGPLRTWNVLTEWNI